MVIMKDHKKHLLGIDTIRSIAISCVVICHVVVGNIYTFNVEFMQTMSTISRGFAFIIFSIGRMGVPFFLLIFCLNRLDNIFKTIAIGIENNIINQIVLGNVLYIKLDKIISSYIINKI